jgi:protein involved in polysaccharide export with SLBB domain
MAAEETEAVETSGDETGRVTEKEMARPLQRFGRNFFEPARRRVLAMEKKILSGKMALPEMAQRDALAGFVGPLEMVTSSVYAAIPHRYVLTPGDQISLTFWGTGLDLQKLTLVVDNRGEVMLPKVGGMVARGMTLDTFQRNAKASLSRVTVRDMELIATLDLLKSIQIFVTGEAFRPGSYAVSAVTTLFNALHAAGGPSDLGSLRDIRLLRDQQAIRIDFYDYLLRGDSQNDFPLRAGDTIFIPQLRRSASIRGEVVRPAIYELKENEQLAALIDLSGGVKATGVLKNVLVRSVSPNKELVIREVDIARGTSDTPVYDGDSVEVSAVLSEITNQVVLKGSVERPGIYELKEGMRIADIFSETNRLLGETHLERADLIRLNEDRKTTRLIPIHLGRALALDPQQNLPLAWMDQLVVYSKFDVAFYPSRIVTILGAAQKPGTYPRSDGMKLLDLLLEAGGVLPGYYEIMEVARARSDGEVTLLPIDIPRLLNHDEAQNIALQDEDIISVRKKSEFFDKPIFVTIQGEVKYPGAYALKTRDDRISDLILRAGGFTERAHLRGGVFTRQRRHIPSEAQRADLLRVNHLSNRINDLDYERLVARNQYLLLQEQGTSVATGTASAPLVRTTGTAQEAIAVGQLPGVAETAGVAAGQAAGGIIGAIQELPSVVSRARQFGNAELAPEERIVVDIQNAVTHPDGPADLALVTGDTLEVPTRSATISVVGAVTRPTVITHASGAALRDYIARAGGYTADARIEGTLVLKVDGAILPVKEVKALEAGDMVYVPPRVMSAEIVTTLDKVLDLVKFTLTTAASVGAFIALIGLL